MTVPDVHPPEVIMTVPESNAVLQLVLQFMRNQSDQSQRIEDRLNGTDSLLLDVRERLIKMEQADHAAQIRATKESVTKMEDRIKQLEDAARERVGMQKLLDLAVKFGPWFVILIGVIVFISVQKGGI